MSANQASLVMTSTMTDAEFRLMSSFIADIMQSGGLTKTADTGQINLVTANYPGSVNTYAGYEIRQFTDALQATAPIYFKIEYGRGNGANHYALQITFGTGTNGTGTITGQFVGGGAAQQVRLAEGANTYSNCIVSAGTCRFGVAIQTATAVNAFLIFERTMTAAKVYTNQGVMFYPWKTGQTSGPRVITYTGVAPAAETGPIGGCLPPGGQTTGLRADGHKANWEFRFHGIGESWPCSMLTGVFVGDYTVHTTHTVNVCGTDQVMIRMALDSNGTTYVQRGTTPSAANFTGMMRHD